MNALWIVVGLGVLGGAAWAFQWSHARGRPAGLGYVSHQWIAEQRASQGQDRPR